MKNDAYIYVQLTYRMVPWIECLGFDALGAEATHPARSFGFLVALASPAHPTHDFTHFTFSFTPYRPLSAPTRAMRRAVYDGNEPKSDQPGALTPPLPDEASPINRSRRPRLGSPESTPTTYTHDPATQPTGQTPRPPSCNGNTNEERRTSLSGSAVGRPNSRGKGDAVRTGDDTTEQFSAEQYCTASNPLSQLGLGRKADNSNAVEGSEKCASLRQGNVLAGADTEDTGEERPEVIVSATNPSSRPHPSDPVYPTLLPGLNVSELEDTVPKEPLPEIYTEYDLECEYDEIEKAGFLSTLQSHAKGAWHEFNFKTWLSDFFPIVKDIKSYSLRALLADVWCGFTIGVIMVPQSLAYAVLCGLPPKYGLYGALVPSIIYPIFGTCRELSIGPFALVSLSIAEAVGRVVPTYEQVALTDPVAAEQLAIPAVMSITFHVGWMLMAMYFLRMGWVMSFFSEPSLLGFICAGAYLVTASQIAAVLQIPLPADFTFHRIFQQIFHNLGSCNVASIIIGVSTVLILYIAQRLTAGRFRTPPPVPLFVLILAIVLSYVLQLHEKYGVKIVGKLDAGFPPLKPPSFQNTSQYFLVSLPVAAVTIVTTVSVSLQLANERGYMIDVNQELWAMGACSLAGSFYACHIPSGSLARSVLVAQMKPASILWNLPHFVIIALCVGALAPLIKHLPYAAFAGLIIFTFQRAITRIVTPFILWKTSPKESLTWSITFLTTIFGGTEFGILAALITSVGFLISDISRPYIAVLGKLPKSRFFRDKRLYPQAREYKETLIVRFDSRLNFANQEYFFKSVSKKIESKLLELEEMERLDHLREKALQLLEAQELSEALSPGKESKHAASERAEDERSPRSEIELTTISGRRSAYHDDEDRAREEVDTRPVKDKLKGKLLTIDTDDSGHAYTFPSLRASASTPNTPTSVRRVRINVPRKESGAPRISPVANVRILSPHTGRISEASKHSSGVTPSEKCGKDSVGIEGHVFDENVDLNQIREQTVAGRTKPHKGQVDYGLLPSRILPTLAESETHDAEPAADESPTEPFSEALEQHTPHLQARIRDDSEVYRKGAGDVPEASTDARIETKPGQQVTRGRSMSGHLPTPKSARSSHEVSTSRWARAFGPRDSDEPPHPVRTQLQQADLSTAEVMSTRQDADARSVTPSIPQSLHPAQSERAPTDLGHRSAESGQPWVQRTFAQAGGAELQEVIDVHAFTSGIDHLPREPSLVPDMHAEAPHGEPHLEKEEEEEFAPAFVGFGQEGLRMAGRPVRIVKRHVPSHRHHHAYHQRAQSSSQVVAAGPTPSASATADDDRVREDVQSLRPSAFTMSPKSALAPQPTLEGQSPSLTIPQTPLTTTAGKLMPATTRALPVVHGPSSGHDMMGPHAVSATAHAATMRTPFRFDMDEHHPGSHLRGDHDVLPQEPSQLPKPPLLKEGSRVTLEPTPVSIRSPRRRFGEDALAEVLMTQPTSRLHPRAASEIAGYTSEPRARSHVDTTASVVSMKVGKQHKQQLSRIFSSSVASSGEGGLTERLTPVQVAPESPKTTLLRPPLEPPEQGPATTSPPKPLASPVSETVPQKESCVLTTPQLLPAFPPPEPARSRTGFTLRELPKFRFPTLVASDVEGRFSEMVVLKQLLSADWRAELPPKLELCVIIYAIGINSIDTTSITMLRRLVARDDVLFIFAEVKDEVRRVLYISDCIPYLSSLIFPDLHDAVIFGRACVWLQREKRRLASLVSSPEELQLVLAQAEIEAGEILKQACISHRNNNL